MAAGGEDFGSTVFDAASSGDVKRLRELVRFKRFSKIRGSLSWRDPFDRTPLMAAAAGGHTDMVRILVEEYGVNIEESKFDSLRGEEFTPLVYAANVGHDKTVKVLLQNGAKVDHAYPLHRACFAAGNLDCVKLLIEHGADPNRKCTDGSEDGEVMQESTPLTVASDQVCLKIVEYLLQKGADPNIADKKGNTPMHSVFEAIWNSHSESRCRGCCVKDGARIVELLMLHGATQKQNAMDLTPVMIGALTGNLSCFHNKERMFGLSPGETVQILELMASHLLLKGKHEDGFQVLYKAKGLLSTKNAEATEMRCPYGDYKEPQSCEELDLLRVDRVYLVVVALVIRERILSSEAQKHYLWKAIRDFVDQCPLTPDGRKLALRALQHETNLEIESGFFCGFAVESLYRLLDPSVVNLQDTTLEDLVILFKLAAINLSPDVSDMNVESRRDAIEYHRCKTITALHLLSLYANYRTLSAADSEMLMTLVQQFVTGFQIVADVILQLREAGSADLSRGEDRKSGARQTESRTSKGISLFHVYYPVLARRRPENDGNITERLTTMLLKCGHDPTQVDPQGYTPLHFLVKTCPGSSQNKSFREGVVTPLANWGCPILRKNPHTGRSVIEDSTKPETKQLLMDLALPTLLDLTARVIRKNQVPYREVVPLTVASFLDMNV